MLTNKLSAIKNSPLLIILLLITLSACGGSLPSPDNTQPPPSEIVSVTPQSIPASTPLPPKTATVAALIAREAGGIRFMTYNVFLGGSLNSENNAKIDLLISIMKTYDPDVLGIQEASGWYLDNYAIADKVADELGMNYVYCKDTKLDLTAEEGFNFDTIIMTKFEIVDSESYPEIHHCTGRAKVLLPDGQTLQVFNVHIPYGSC